MPVGGTGSLLKIERLIDDINIVVSEYFSLIQLKDWIEMFEILEVQSADVIGFFHYKPPTFSHDDDVVIQDVFTYFETLYRDNSETKVLSLFPQAVQELFKLHHNVVNFLVSQICDPVIYKDDRVGRNGNYIKGTWGNEDSNEKC